MRRNSWTDGLFFYLISRDALLIFAAWLLLPLFADCEDISAFHLTSDSGENRGFRHFEISSGTKCIQVTWRHAERNKGERVLLIIPSKTTVRPESGSLSEVSLQMLNEMCPGESTFVVDWDKGVEPYFEQGQTTRDYADSILIALEFLQAKNLITISQLGILAHSEGALVAMMVAERVKPKPCFAILFAPPGIRGDQLTIAQNDDFYANIPSKATDSLLENQFRRLRQEPDQKKVEREFEGDLRQIYSDSVPPALIHDTAIKFSSPWMKAFIDIDPSRLISGMHCSWLAVWGSDDKIILPGPNMVAYKLSSRLGRADKGEVLLVDGYDHFFGRTKPPESAMELGIGSTVRAWYIDKWQR